MNSLSRRSFTKATFTAAVALAAGTRAGRAAASRPRRIRTGVIGCGSVSNSYLPVLRSSPFVEVVSLCDIRPERARAQAGRFNVPHHYPHIDDMLDGEPFEFLVDLTDMQEHEAINRRALEAGKHVWSEKPIANSLAAGRELLHVAGSRNLRLWGAPITVESPQFAFMARQLAAGKLGRVAAAHAQYGHEGPGWSAFFYEKDGGSLPDLAVYNLTSLTGLHGPARRVSAMLSIVTPGRTVEDRGRIRVEEEDNAMVLLDHGNGVLSHVQSGFNYFNPHGHDGARETRHTIQIVGTAGYMGLVGYDWAPLGVDVALSGSPLRRHETDPRGYAWQNGAALAAESIVTGRDLLVTPGGPLHRATLMITGIVTGRDLLVTPEHALHVLEIITAARLSHETGRRIPLESTFRWPCVS